MSQLRMLPGADARAEAAAEAARVDKAQQNTTQGFKYAYHNTLGYIEDSNKILGEMNKPGVDQQSWKALQNQLRALNSANAAVKLNTPLVQVPAYYKGDEEKVISALDAAQQAAQGQPLTKRIGIGPVGVDVQTQQGADLQAAQQAAQAGMFRCRITA
jgi:hypothetical protein